MGRNRCFHSVISTAVIHRERLSSLLSLLSFLPQGNIPSVVFFSSKSPLPRWGLALLALPEHLRALGNWMDSLFCFVVCSAFALPELPLPHPTGFLTVPVVVLSPFLRLWWLAAGVKPVLPIQSDFSFCFIDCHWSLCRLLTNDKQLYCYRIKRYVSFFTGRMVLFLYSLPGTIASYTPSLYFIAFYFPSYTILLYIKVKKKNCHIFWGYLSDLSNTASSKLYFTSIKDSILPHYFFPFLYSVDGFSWIPTFSQKLD